MIDPQAETHFDEAAEEPTIDCDEEYSAHDTSDGGTTALAMPHPRFGEARERAYQLHRELDHANAEYKRELVAILNNLRRDFMRKYHTQLTELDELNEAIHSIQHGGLKSLRRELMQLQLTDASYEDIRAQSRALAQRYREVYYPQDNYQRRCDREALKLRNAILPMLGGGGGGGGLGGI